jgi:flagellar M-ring protein FliF
LPNGVGFQGNQGAAVASNAAGNEATTNETRTDTKSIPGHERSRTELVSLAPKKVTAVIGVPASYYVKVWNQQNLPQPGEPAKTPDPAALAKIETDTINKIKEEVRNLLPPFVVGTEPYPHITVSTYTDLPAAAPASPTLAAQATAWLADNWRTLGMIVLGCFSLLMLRSMVRSTAGGPAPTLAAAREPAPRLAATPEVEEPEAEPAAVLRKRFQSSGPDLKAELHELVKEHPDAAANVLRMWIGDAA